MSDLSSFTGKFRVQSNAVNGSSKVTKRLRPSLVCNQCRKNKLRCDRSQPCGSCVKRDEADACSYQRGLGPQSELSRQAVAEDRLMQLELTIKQLMQNQASVQTQNGVTCEEVQLQPLESPPNAPDAAQKPCRGQNETTRYVGSTHWSSILDDIHELQTVLVGSADELDIEYPKPQRIPDLDSELIFGAASAYSVQQIMSESLPPRVEVDRLVATYFRGEAYIVPFIHTHQFQRQYRTFWADTTQVNPLWLAQLFCICQMGLYVGQTAGSSHSSQGDPSDAQSIFHAAAAQCLVAGRYHRPQRFAPEALGLYAQCKNLKSLDSSREVGAILGMAVRVAYQMGYHRDPDVLGSFSVFEGEMRRRAWSSCKQMDLMISFQLGLPSNICLENCDTKSPRNLFDSDFDEETQALPASRPESEVTPLLWYVVKDRQMINFSKVCRNALSFNEMSETDIAQLDSEIWEIHKTFPDVLQTRPLSESITDAPFLIITRFFIEFIHSKSLCVLHRRYMARGSIFSTRRCLDAATRLVSQFIDMYQEFSPGGQLCFEGWMLTSFSMNDFLLGVMMLCLFLHIRRKHGAPDPITDDVTRKEVRALLEQSQAICIEKSAASRDARRVSYAIRQTLNGTEFPYVPAEATGIPGSATSASVPINTPSAIEETAGTNLALLSLNSQFHRAGSHEVAFGLLDPFNFMSNDLVDIDWPELDSEIFDTLHE